MKRFYKCAALVLCLVTAFSMAACGGKSDENVLRVYMPDGAPALALAGMMATDDERYDFTVVPSSDIGNRLKAGDADIAIAPTNAAVNLFNKGKDYRIAALATVGNLYLIGKGAFTLDDLEGAVVGVFGQNNVPDLVLRALFLSAGIENAVSDEAQAGRASLKYYADGPAVMQAVAKGIVAYGLLPEPAATAALAKIEGATLLDVQAERQKTTGSYGYPQAVLVFKGEAYDADKAAFGAFLDAYTASGDWAEQNPQAAADVIAAHMAEGVQPGIAKLSAETAARCNIDVSRVTLSVRKDVEAFIDDIIDLGAAESVGGRQPDPSIYLMAA